MSGCGKSTVGEALAKRLNVTFEDGDSFHPQSNIDKMSNGTPLTDEDRFPWLARIRASALTITQKQSKDKDTVVIACSALKKRYRAILRGAEDHPNVKSSPNDEQPSSHTQLDHTAEETKDVKPLAPHEDEMRTFFLFIDGRREVLLERMSARKGHFMKEKMLDSQLETLERPDESGEEGVVVIALEADPESQVDQAIAGLKAKGYSELSG